jgi:KDO2-lipid IV(A) lauroyltransferase
MFKVLPLDYASAIRGALARGIGPFLPVSRHARRNISRAFPVLSETEIAGVVAGMWDNLGRLAAEYPHLRIKSASSSQADASRRTASSMSSGRWRPGGR